MKFAILALGLVLAIHDTQAQTSNTPSCALGCITSAAQAAGCSISDISCLCGSSFRSATERCVSQGVCEPNDQNTLNSVLSALCNGAASSSGAGSGPSTGTGPVSSKTSAAGTTTDSITIHISNTPKPPITTGSLTIISSLIPPAPSTADTTSAANPSESASDSAAPAPTSPSTSTSTLAPTSAPISVPTVPLPTPATTLNGPSTSVIFSTVASDGLPTPATSQPAGSSANRLGIPSGVALCVVLSMLLVHNF